MIKLNNILRPWFQILVLILKHKQCERICALNGGDTSCITKDLATRSRSYMRGLILNVMLCISDGLGIFRIVVRHILVLLGDIIMSVRGNARAAENTFVILNIGRMRHVCHEMMILASVIAE